MSYISHFGKASIISLGNALEWYDFCIFGYFAKQIGNTFFPGENTPENLLFAFITFAIGVMVRPLGGFIFGYLGNRVGRYYATNLAIITMGMTTLVIALLPGYNQIGIAAPFLLVIFRIIQGLSFAEQYDRLVIITTEDPQVKYTGFYIGLTTAISLKSQVF